MAVSKNRKFAQIANDVASDGTLTAAAISSDVTLGGTTVYATLDQLPRSGNTSGDTVFVTGTSRFYIWNGVGWFNVALVNAAPSITNAPSATYNLYANGSPTIITLAATDAEGDSLTWSYDAPNATGKATITQDSAVFTITPLTNIADTSFDIDFEVTDGINVSTATSTINIDNRAPSITTSPDATYTLATDGSPTVITLAATDPDGGSITWTYADSSLTNQATVTQNGNEFTITPNSTPAAYADFTLTFTASDSIESTSTDPTTFSLTFILVVDEWVDTAVSIGTSSTNSLDNSTFIDRSTNTHSVTTSGDPTQTAFHPYLDNWSAEFDGTDDGIAISNYGSTLDMSFSGEFTIEYWYYQTTSQSYATQFGLYQTSGNNRAITVMQASSGNPMLYISSNGSGFSTRGLGAKPLNEWTHVAITRDSSDDVRVFRNGVQQGSDLNFPSIYSGGATPFVIGAQWDGTGVYREFPGNISNFRFVKGTALYTSDFTPPTEKLTAITNTALLTCQSNRFIDNSTNGLTITPYGNSKTSAFNPFGQESEYATGENKGSAYFDGTSYLSVPNSSDWAPGTGDFCYEGWFKFANDNVDVGLFCPTVLNNGAFDIRRISDGTLRIGRYNTAWDSYTSSLTLSDAWHHIAFVRNSGTVAIYVDGVDRIQTGASNTQNYGISTSTLSIGDNATVNEFSGYMSDIRITKGSPVYTSAFTPPTSPVGNTGASLYLPMDNAGIFDKTGNTTLVPTGTFSGMVDPETTSSNTAVATTAIAFNNRPLLLTDIGLSIISGDFTVEFWAECNSQGQACILFDNHPTAYNGSFSMRSDYVSGTNSTMYGSVCGHNFNFSYPVADFLNTPAHWAITKEGSSVKIFLNGVQKNTTGTATGTSDISDGIYIGGAAGPTSGYSNLVGMMEGFQIHYGLAKYTQNFTPPTQEQGRTYQLTS